MEGARQQSGKQQRSDSSVMRLGVVAAAEVKRQVKAVRAVLTRNASRSGRGSRTGGGGFRS